jgi:hypothetical protein
VDVQTLTLIILLGTLNGRLVTRFYLGKLNNGINTAGILENIPANTFHYKVRAKVKFTLKQAMKTQCGRYSSTLSLTLALDGGVNATPQLLYPRERDPVPIVYEAGRAPEPVWTGAENLTSTGIQSLHHPACGESLY